VKHRHVVLSDTATFDKKDGALKVVIETPKGSPNKYDYNPDCDCFELKTTLPEGLTFPFDFGFVPSTLGDDGDPLDVLVLMDFPVIPGCLLSARLIGCIEAEQKEKDSGWFRNDRLIAVSVHARAHSATNTLKDLRPHMLDETKAFFVEYNKMHDKKFRPIGDRDAKQALALVGNGMKKFKKKRG
jgi:inorganic pyrophosphatase